MKVNHINSHWRHQIIFYFFVLTGIFSSMASKIPFSNFRMSYRDNPQHSAVIGWSGSRNAILYFDTVSRGGNYQNYKYHAGVSAFNHYKGQDNNFVRFADLASGTRYYFILRDTIGGVLSREMSFKTLPEKASTLLIVIGGDSRNSMPIYEMSPKKCREGFRKGNMLVSKIVPDIVVFGGDFVMNMLFWRRSHEWQQWLSDWQLTITPDGLLIPIIPAIGNHEDPADMVNFFDMPLTNGVYNHLLGGNLISLTTLNNMKAVCNPSELNTVDSLMSYDHSAAKWQVVQYHIPMNPQGKKYSKRKDLIQCWAPIFQKWGVDIVSESHTHIMKTTYPVVIDSSNFNNPFSRNDSLGMVFIGEGAWGAPLRALRPTNDYIKSQVIVHGFHILQVSGDSIQISAISFGNVETVTQSPSNRSTLQLPDNLQRIPEKDGIPLVIKRSKNR